MKYPISYILSNGFKGRQFTITDEDYDSIVIHDDKGIITMEEIEQADTQLQHQYKIDEIKIQYPSDSEKLNALWDKFVNNNSDKLTEIINKINILDEKIKVLGDTCSVEGIKT